MKRAQIVIADDHEIVRIGVRSILNSRSDWEVCAEAENGYELIEKVQQFMPDVVITDLAMPRLSGIEATRHIARSSPHLKVLILTIYDAETVARQVLEAGARGLLLKSDAINELNTAVESLLRGGFYFSHSQSDRIIRGFLHGGPRGNGRERLNPLTPREAEMVGDFARGRTTREVAEAIGVTVKTVETHRSNIMHKLGLHSLSELVLYAVRNRLISLESEGQKAMTPAGGRATSSAPTLDGEAPEGSTGIGQSLGTGVQLC